MLNGHKLFALCTARIQNAEVLQSVKAFLQEARERGHFVIVFNSNLDSVDVGSSDSGSYSVYDLIPYSITDAVVIMPETIQNEVVTNTLLTAAQANHRPVLSYDGFLSQVPSVYSYSNQAFDTLLEHILQVHKCHRVDLITGVPGNYGSECMVLSYREALHKAGILFDQQRVEYGEYWEEPAIAATERLLAYDVPEAIVCVNDEMAIACCATLQKRGLRVPDDVLVTGLDGIVRERFHTPRLTTCAKDVSRLSAALFDTAELLLEGETVDLDCQIPPVTRISESCGCRPIEQQDYNMAIRFLYRCLQLSTQQESYEHRVQGLLMEREQNTVIDYLDVLANHMSEDAYLCLRDCVSPELTASSLRQFADQTELMSTVALKRREKQYAIITRAQLIPDLGEVLQKGRALFLTSVHLQNEIYGYYAYYGNNVDEESFQLPKFIHTAGNVIGSSLTTGRLQAMNEKLLASRIRDPLTGMLNLPGLLKALTERLHTENSDGQQLVLVVIGLKNLRKINSIFGHLEGDQALTSLANAINDCIDSDVTAARIGGDEFLVSFFTSSLRADTADALITVLMNRLHSYNQVSGKNYSLEITLGRVSAPATSSLSLEALLNEAVAQKDEKRTNLLKENGQLSRISSNDAVAQQVEQVLSNNLLTYHFQPIVSAKTGQIYAYETLMRTAGEARVPALIILQYATAMGRLYEVEWLTYYNVLRCLREKEAAFADKKLFINSIPGHFITDSDFAKLQTAYGDLLPKLVVEFTEQAETEGDELKRIQQRCAANHMEIAVDDYGTGYSNITNLLRYSPNFVKIDRSLISNIHEEPKKQHFVTNIIEFAHANGFMALAEGVETLEEMRAVIRFGVDLIQGNYTALPAPEPISEIDPGIAALILKISTTAENHFIRKTFMPTADNRVDMAQLAMEKYTDIFIAQPYVELIGDFNVPTGLTIKIKDGINCRLVLHDVHLCATHSTPCIILGRKSNVTIECRGDNRLDHAGISVPESSALHLTGRGNLTISCTDVQSSAIGSDTDVGFGSILVDLAGCLQITSDGNQCIGIGGGCARGQMVSICGTRVFMQMTGVDSVGIGAFTGNCEISMAGCSANFDMRTACGVAIGVQKGTPTISFNTTNIECNASGKSLTVVGSESGGGTITLIDSVVHACLTGRDITVIGSDDCAPVIALRRCEINLHCEGTRVLDIGSVAEDALLTILDTNFTMRVQSANALHLAAADGHRICSGGSEHMDINQ